MRMMWTKIDFVVAVLWRKHEWGELGDDELGVILGVNLRTRASIETDEPLRFPENGPCLYMVSFPYLC